MKYLSPAEFAQRLNVATVTVRKWAQKGMLNPVRTPGGHRRYTEDELEHFARKYDIPLNAANPPVSCKLLIVDNDDQFRRYLQVRIESIYGESIYTDQAIDGFDAGKKIHSCNPDVILLDLLMPGINGFEICRSIKSDKHTRHIRIIAMTGFHNDHNVDQILSAGAETCLAKPIDVKKLISAIAIAPPVATQSLPTT